MWATIIGMAILYAMNKWDNKKVLQKAQDTDEKVTKVYRLTDGAVGQHKRAIAISKANEATSLRSLSRMAHLAGDLESQLKYEGQADVAEKDALVAKQAADSHEARLAAIEMEHQSIPELKRIADSTAVVAESIGVSKAAADAVASKAAEAVKSANPEDKK